MLKGYVSYRISNSGHEFAPTTFLFPGSPGISVTLNAPAAASPDDASVHLRIDFDGEFTPSGALSEATATAAAVADRLAYQWGRYLSTPTLSEVAFDDGGVRSLGHSLGLTCSGVAVKALDSEAVDELRDQLAKTDFPGDPHLATFRAALGCNDPIGQFLCLYGILMTVAGDDQRAIDVLIERHEPGQIRTPRPDRPTVQETPYTRLRNEVAHRLRTRTVGAIRAEMEQRCPNLIAIVRRAIA